MIHEHATRRRAHEPHNWPEVDADEFIITVDVDLETESEHPLQPWLVFRVGDQVLYRRPSGYENGAHIIAACRDMRGAYSGRVRDFEVTPGAANCIYLDDWRAGAKLKKAFRGLRKDYLRRKVREKRARQYADWEVS